MFDFNKGGHRISIHSPRMGRDRFFAMRFPLFVKFQSTLPAWGETEWYKYLTGSTPISIHSPRMGRDAKPYIYNPADAISIHSPRMGRDAWSHS